MDDSQRIKKPRHRILPEGLSPAIRKWECPSCKTVHHRDENAARNGLQIIMDDLEKKMKVSGSDPISFNDEAHRSIYGDSRECVQYFQAVRVGLTATPKAYLKNINNEN